MNIWRAIKELFRREEKVHIISRLPIGFEMSEGEKSRLYSKEEVSRCVDKGKV